MPVTKTFWRGKLVHAGFGAYNEVVLVTSVPVTSIYCTIVSIHAPISKCVMARYEESEFT